MNCIGVYIETQTLGKVRDESYGRIPLIMFQGLKEIVTLCNGSVIKSNGI
jgi:hypothetical protein